ncbi:MAG: GNAT family N-acetyltransferase [Fimbriimonadaceae bacterium]|nr:GNAT family N-acetyltransferase [Fimbriimonadaceae bacterium]QYK55110.1 MAG: GNAT family N-acetyltransferase [Fimbriimonadaceae bacterium]
MTVPHAVRVFALGFAQVRNRTFPARAEWHEGLWVIQDATPRRNRRKAEVVAAEIDAADAVALCRRLNPGRHFLCHIDPTPSPLPSTKHAYKALGYRFLGTEGLFVHDLKNVPDLASDPPVRAYPEELARTLRCQGKPGLPWVTGARHYAVVEGGEVLGRVRSVPVDHDSWVSDLVVVAERRGQGYGRALMSAMMQDDVRHGVQTSVLLASADGARLYPHLGYRCIGTLQLFGPVSAR